MRWFIILSFILLALAEDFDFEEELSREGIIFRPLLKGKISYSFAEIGFTYHLQPLYEDFTILGKNIQILMAKCDDLRSNEHCIQSTEQLNARYGQVRALRGKYIPFINVRRNRGIIEFNFQVGNEMKGQIEYSRMTTLNTSAALQHFIEENNKALSNIDETIRNLTIELNKADQILYSQINDNYLETQYLNLYQRVSESLQVQEELTNTIVDIVRDVTFGNLMKIVGEDLITQNYLELQDRIRPNEELIMEIFHSLHTIKKTLKFNVRLNSNRLFINVIIPIAKRGNFTLFQPISVPTKIGTEWYFIEPTYDYLIANEDFSTILPTTRADLDSSIALFSGNSLLFPRNRISNNILHSCEATILNNNSNSELIGKCSLRKVEKSNFMIQLYDLDIYFCSMLQPITILSKCNYNESNTSILPQSGFLILHPFCTYSINGEEIQTSNKYYFNVTTTIQPYNLITGIF